LFYSDAQYTHTDLLYIWQPGGWINSIEMKTVGLFCTAAIGWINLHTKYAKQPNAPIDGKIQVQEVHA